MSPFEKPSFTTKPSRPVTEKIVTELKDEFGTVHARTEEYIDDPIRPAHYLEGGIDVFKYGKANFSKEELRGYFKGNIIKYITRFNKKNGVEDLRKAERFLEELIELEESN
ncbi:DUF3310 domain-containing protein [Sporosarcina highlanderae]|uniref:DUF3310 domain-containing protein n=1 Tax=Sporosarcina highlanderae TaxID=3035916 RepID=A0ABT8JWA5_9BACL|nr:DUF3310 domain-containing protein [Sporosarcina highlanderae]MDN4609142.1 DUF3310 domain-containing protein [Sporosarcina highlanderae]